MIDDFRIYTTWMGSLFSDDKKLVSIIELGMHDRYCVV